jgi:hypothetical protein
MMLETKDLAYPMAEATKSAAAAEFFPHQTGPPV